MSETSKQEEGVSEVNLKDKQELHEVNVPDVNKDGISEAAPLDKMSDCVDKVIYKFCDLKKSLVEAWKNQFKEYMPDRVQVYKGDIFANGPSADAIVSPANSFGFMDGGIDMVYSRHFGWQMQERLQKLIRTNYDGELLVGQAAIITTVEKHNRNTVEWSKYNAGQPITYLISAPTMRVPMDVSDTCNAYLAFRGIILAVKKFNASHPDKPIRSVLCPGLGTAVGMMPSDRCALQMLYAFETYEIGKNKEILNPDNLMIPMMHSCYMSEYEDETVKKEKPKAGTVIKDVSPEKPAGPVVTDVGPEPNVKDVSPGKTVDQSIKETEEKVTEQGQE
ncbi:hypothetical protein ACF0H5_008246 [Mactra antiquata]